MRCEDAGSRDYRWYGAKGIRMCARWRDGTRYSDSDDRTSGVGFKNFHDDMAGFWFAAAHLDKDLGCLITGLREYGPSTCEWVTREENMRRRKLL